MNTVGMKEIMKYGNLLTKDVTETLAVHGNNAAFENNVSTLKRKEFWQQGEMYAKF